MLWKKSQQDKLKDGRQNADQRHCHSSERNRELGEKSAGEIIISLLIVFSDVRSENEGITAKWDIPPCCWRCSVPELSLVSRTLM